MLPDKMEHCIVFMNSWDVSGVFWSFSKCNITIPHLPADPSSAGSRSRSMRMRSSARALDLLTLNSGNLLGTWWPSGLQYTESRYEQAGAKDGRARRERYRLE